MILQLTRLKPESDNLHILIKRGPSPHERQRRWTVAGAVLPSGYRPLSEVRGAANLNLMAAADHQSHIPRFWAGDGTQVTCRLMTLTGEHAVYAVLCTSCAHRE
jgi:hypothetical protein